MLCVVDELEHARLDADGLTSCRRRLDEELERRRAAEAEHERCGWRKPRRATANVAVPKRPNASGGELSAPAYPRLPTSSVAPRPERGPIRVIADDEPDWPRDVGIAAAAARRRGARAPVSGSRLSTDVACDVPVAIWRAHGCAGGATERAGDPPPMAVRAGIVAEVRSTP